MPQLIRKITVSQLMSALALQKRTGCPSMTLSNTPVARPSTSMNEPMNKRNRLKKRPMEEATKLEIYKRTGSTPYLEVVYQ